MFIYKSFSKCASNLQRLNKLISWLILNSVEKNNRCGSNITQHSNKNETKIKLFDDPLKG